MQHTPQNLVKAKKITHDWVAETGLFSVEFLEGFEAAVAWRLAGSPERGRSASPYEPGTAQADAWKSGREHGRKVRIR